MTKILIALVQLTGGIAAKDDSLKRYTAEPGTELTPAVLKKLGLKDDDLADLTARGLVGKIDVREAGDDAAGDAALADQLAAAIKRAEEAEAALAELQKEVAEVKQQLDEATKPAAQTPAS